MLSIIFLKEKILDCFHRMFNKQYIHNKNTPQLIWTTNKITQFVGRLSVNLISIQLK